MDCRLSERRDRTRQQPRAIRGPQLVPCLLLALWAAACNDPYRSSSPASATLSELECSPSAGIAANGTTGATTITVRVLDASARPVAGVEVVLAATGSNNTLVQPGPTNAAGETTGLLSSTFAESKTITASTHKESWAVALAQIETVTFVGDAGAISDSLSTVTAAPTLGVAATGLVTSTITVRVLDANSNPVEGQIVQLAATGTNNTIVQPAVTNATGHATGTIASTTAETKTITATVNPGAGQIVITQAPTVAFVGDPSTISAALSTVVAAPSTGVIANGVATSTITVRVLDTNSNPVAGQAVQIASTGSNNTLVQPPVTDADGYAAGTIATTTAQTKTITATVNPGAGQVVVTQQPTVAFVGDPSTISAALSTAVAAPSTGVIANGVATSTITVRVLDANSNPVAGQAVTIASTGSNNTLVQPPVTDSNGYAAGTIASTMAQTKTITATVNPGAGQVVVTQQPTIAFVGDPSTISAALSTAVAAPSTGVIANGVATSTITVRVLDANSNPVAGQAVQLSSTGSNNTFVQPPVTGSNGYASGTLATTTAQTKTITATINPGAGQVVVTQAPTVGFVGDPSTISAALSTAIAAPSTGVIANGVATSTITVRVLDANSNPVAGQAVQLSSTGSSNTFVQPPVTDSNGYAAGTLATTSAQTKTITATVNPGAGQVVVTQQPTVAFVGDPSTISAALSTAVAAPSTGVIANGVATSTVTVRVLDANSNPVAGQAVTLASTGSNNTLVQPPVTDSNGYAAGTIATTTAQTKTITATVNPGAGQVVVTQTPTVGFVGDPSTISAALSTAIAAPSTGVIANGVATSTITVRVLDANSNPVAGQAVQLAATGSNNTLVQPPVTDSNGYAAGTIATTTAQTKTITATVNPGAGQVVVTQTPTVTFAGDPSTLSASLSTVSASPTTGLAANGTATSTVTITLRDANSNVLAGLQPVLAVNGALNTIVQPGLTNSSGQAVGTVATTRAETKTFVVSADPGGGAVTITQQPTVAYEWPLANHYYVRATGSDAAAGTSPATAWLTIGRAATVAAGSTVHVGAGTYTERVVLAVDGAAVSPIRFLADPEGAFCGDAGQVVVDAAGQAEAFSITGDHVAVEDFVIRGAVPVSGAGIRITGTSVTARGNRIFGCTNGVTVAGSGTGGWWNSAYGYRKKITFGTAHSLLPSGFTAALVIDTRTASTNVLLASGDDVRIVWCPAAGATVELDRLGSAWNVAATTISFRLQSAISQNLTEDADGSYWVYYGNAAAGTPPTSEGNVYWWADWFNRADSTTVGNGWVEVNTAGNVEILSNALVISPTGNGTPPQAIARVTFPLGALPGDFRVSFSWTMPTNSENTWSFWGMNVGSSASMVDTNRITGVGPALYNGEALGLTGLEAIDNNMSGALENSINGAHTFRADVRVGAQVFDYWRNGVLRTSNVPWANSVATLDQYRVGGDNFAATAGTAQVIDTLQIELTVTDDPETAASSEESPVTASGALAVVEGNSISANSAHGVALAGAIAASVRSNLVYANSGDGVQVTAACSTALIQGNTLDANTGSQVSVDVTSNTATLRDNIATSGITGFLVQAGAAVVTSDHNDAFSNATNWSGLAMGTGDFSADPLYVDRDGVDNVLGGTGGADDNYLLGTSPASPCFDTGTAAASASTWADGTTLADRSSRVDATLDGTSPDGATANLGYHGPSTDQALVARATNDLRAVYGTGSERQLRTRQFAAAGSTWSAALRTTPAQSSVRWVEAAASPAANSEELLASLADTGAGTVLDVLRWDGAAWQRDVRETVVPTATERGFALACEQTSADALLVFTDGTQNPRFRTRTAGTWTASAAVFGSAPGASAVLWVVLVPKPSSNEIACVYADAALDLYAVIWDGSAWNAASTTTLTANLAAVSTRRCFDAAYEATSGDLLVAWGEGTGEQMGWVTRAAGVWSGGTVASANAQAAVLRLGSNPGSDQIAAVLVEAVSDTDVAAVTWDGSAWGTATQLDASAAAGATEAAIAFVSNTAVLVYPDADGAGLDWATWTFGGGWTLQADVVLAGVGDFAALRLARSGASLIGLHADATSVLWAVSCNGSTWSLGNAGTSLEASLPSIASLPFAIF